MSRPLIVVAAVIEKDGLILIGQRRRSDRHALKWEFPGGKVERGETPEAALQRELEEELAIQAHIGPEISRYQFQYPHRPPVVLMFFRVGSWSGEPTNAAFEQLQWSAPQKLPEFDFLEGDADFVRWLADNWNT